MKAVTHENVPTTLLQLACGRGTLPVGDFCDTETCFLLPRKDKVKRLGSSPGSEPITLSKWSTAPNFSS